MGYGNLRRGRHSAAGQEYLVTTVCMDRSPLLGKVSNAWKLAEELHALDTEGGAEWLAWVIMPDHFHGLLRLAGERSLSDVMRRVKGRSSRRIGGSLWQPGFHDHALRRDEDRGSAARYLLANPIRAGLVESLCEYPFWYCRWFEPGNDPDAFLRP